MNVVFALFILAVAFIMATINAGLHRIDEGHVGVYHRGGALLTSTSGPGFSVMIPFLDSVQQVQTTMQTDYVENIPCGTSGGTQIHFSKIEVVNRLAPEAVYAVVKNYTVDYDKVMIYDRVHHEVNQFCSKHSLIEVAIEKFSSFDDMLMESLQQAVNKYAPGLEIIAVRISKPQIPPAIVENFEKREAEKSKYNVAIEAQRVAEKEAETQRMRMRIEAETRAEVSKIEQLQKEAERESQRRQAEIADKQLSHHEKTLADAAFYAAEKEAAANALLHTDAFIRLELARLLANNTKVYFNGSSGLGGMLTELVAGLNQKS